MATRVFSEEELARLRGFPEITGDELVLFFTLAAADPAVKRDLGRQGFTPQLRSLRRTL